MTPAALTLSREILALPGAPTFSRRAVSGYRLPDGLSGLRTPDGLGWVPGSDDRSMFVLDLDDAATGGVMLARVRDIGIVEIGADTYSLRYDMDCPANADGHTLALALAHVIKARGAW